MKRMQNNALRDRRGSGPTAGGRRRSQETTQWSRHEVRLLIVQQTVTMLS